MFKKCMMREGVGNGTPQIDEDNPVQAESSEVVNNCRAADSTRLSRVRSAADSLCNAANIQAVCEWPQHSAISMGVIRIE